MRREEAASSNGRDTTLSRLRREFDSPRCYQLMSTQTIELEGFEIELASELYCDRGGDHRQLVNRARTDRGMPVGLGMALGVSCSRKEQPCKIWLDLYRLGQPTSERHDYSPPVLETAPVSCDTMRYC